MSIIIQSVGKFKEEILVEDNKQATRNDLEHDKFIISEVARYFNRWWLRSGGKTYRHGAS